MQESDIKVGMLFRYNKRMSIHDDVHGHIGVVLGRCNVRQWKVQVSHKTLWITPWSMEKI
jgi:hypothetical protein